MVFSSVFLLLITGAFFFRYLYNRSAPQYYKISSNVGLSNDSVSCIQALIETLVPEHLWHENGEIRRTINGLINADKSVQKEYIDGVMLLNKYSIKMNKKQFSSLNRSQRNLVLDIMLSRYNATQVDSYIGKQISKLRVFIERMILNEPERRFRDLVVRDLLVRFYASDISWGFVKYQNYPGVSGDPREYTRKGA